MISFAQELLCSVVQEVQPLLELHYQELTAHKEVVKLDPRWGDYLALERIHRLAIFTARDDGKLVGYSAFFMQPHMHYSALTVAQNDVFYVAEGHRRGSMPLRFLRYSEAALREMGAQKLVYHCKPSNNFAPILHRLGYADEEVMAGKLL